MRKIELKCNLYKGAINMDSHEFIRLVRLLDDGNAVITVELLPDPKTIEEFRKQYFAMRDLVAKETGNQKEDIHKEAKERFLKLDGCTTKFLNETGWKNFIIDFKSWAFEHFNVYL